MIMLGSTVNIQFQSVQFHHLSSHNHQDLLQHERRIPVIDVHTSEQIFQFSKIQLTLLRPTGTHKTIPSFGLSMKTNARLLI